MSDIAAAFGLLLVLEGAIYALFPEQMKRIAARALQTPPETLRMAGLGSAALGVAVVWMVRG